MTEWLWLLWEYPPRKQMTWGHPTMSYLHSNYMTVYLTLWEREAYNIHICASFHSRSVIYMCIIHISTYQTDIQSQLRPWDKLLSSNTSYFSTYINIQKRQVGVVLMHDCKIAQGLPNSKLFLKWRKQNGLQFLFKAEVLPSNNSAESVRALGKIGLKCWQDMNIHDGF